MSRSKQLSLRTLTGTAVLVLFAATAWSSVVRDEGEGQPIRASMRELFERMEILIPLSVDDQAFVDPANAQQIRSALADVEARAGLVSQHAGKEDRRVRFLAGSLEFETRETLRRFEAGQVESAQLFVQSLTDFCVACHTGLPSSVDSPLAKDFVSDSQLAELPPEQRATLQIATRRFGDALTTLETVIASPTVHAAELIDPVTSYLTLSIRVKNDLERPIPTLRKLAARPDLWRHLRSDVERWIESLERHRDDPVREPSLAHVHAILNEARAQIRFPSDRLALVHYLRASAELHRFLELRRGESGIDIAEAYYLLGLVQSRFSTNYWVAESDFYLETAIRMAPHTEIGRRAYDLFEEEKVVSWYGTNAADMPPDVQAQLDELRGLIEDDSGEGSR